MLAHEQAEIQRIDNVLFHIFVLSLYSLKNSCQMYNKVQ